MKVLIAALPFDTAPDSISLAMPTLLAQLEHANIDAKGIDFNVELYADILTEKFIKNSINKIKEEYKNLLHNNDKSIAKKKKLLEIILKRKKNVETLIKKLPEIKKEFKNKQISLGIRIPKNILKILKIAFAPYDEYAPWKSFSYNYNYERIKNFSNSKKDNLFYNFLLKNGNKYHFEKYDVIGISMPLENSIYYGLTLAGYIKEKSPKTKIVFGGTIITRLWDDFIKFPEMFDKFCDNLLVGDGDVSIVKYIQYVENKISPTEVPGLIYKDNNNKLINNEPIDVNINSIQPPSYKGIDISKYPKNIIANLQFSRGCPWSKCAFCTFSYPYRKMYSILSVKKAADMIENIVETYNIRDLYIVDETVPYEFFCGLADEIVKRNIKIRYDCRLRFDDIYTQDFFDLLAESGLRSIFWGYEATSERVLKLMNKGITSDNRNNILKMAKQAGIINKLGIIFGFPGETEEEINQTIDFILENFQKTFDRLGISIFQLTKNSYVINSPEKYGITDIKRSSDFGIGYFYEDKTLSRDRVYELITLCLGKIDELKKIHVQNEVGCC